MSDPLVSGPRREGTCALKVTAYELVPPDPLGGGPLRHGVMLTLVYGRDVERWAIKHGSDVLNKDGEWEWEPQPSSRDDAFFARCRWATADEAYTAWRSRRVSDPQETDPR